MSLNNRTGRIRSRRPGYFGSNIKISHVGLEIDRLFRDEGRDGSF